MDFINTMFLWTLIGCKSHAMFSTIEPNAASMRRGDPSANVPFLRERKIAHTANLERHVDIKEIYGI